MSIARRSIIALPPAIALAAGGRGEAHRTGR